MIIPIKQILVEDESLMGQMGQLGQPVHQAEIPDPFEKTGVQKINDKIQQYGIPVLAGAGTAAAGSLLYHKLKSRQR